MATPQKGPILKRLRPSPRGYWVILLGLILAPIILFSERATNSPSWPWITMFVIFLGLFIHRLSLVYELTSDSLTAFSWWGLGVPERVSLNCLSDTEILRGFSMRIVGLGHVRISSSNINEPTLTLVAQPNPEELVLELEDIARSRGALQGAQLP